jgi:polysaccharide biosynthesis protein VpsQ
MKARVEFSFYFSLLMPIFSSMRWSKASRRSSHRRLKGLALLYLCLFGWILVLAYSGNLPSQLSAIPYYDKFGHVILYGVATYLGQRLFHRFTLRLGRYRLSMWVVAFSIWTLIEEGAQSFAPTRSLDAMDLVCSALGIGIGYWLAARELSRQGSSS